MKLPTMTIWRNFLIAAGFYGIYYAAIQFIALIWRRLFVYDRTFSGTSGELLMWFLGSFPLGLYCIISGFLIPFVIESRRKYAWSIVLGSLFVLNCLLFTTVHYAEAPRVFDITKRCINIISPIMLCPFGAYLYDKYKIARPEQAAVADR